MGTDSLGRLVRLRETEAVQRTIRCARCQASPRRPCVTPSGNDRADSHSYRYWAAVDRGDLPRPAPLPPPSR